MPTATQTKAALEARIAELETQLAASTVDPKEAGMTKLVGLIKSIKDISRHDSDRIVAGAILVNQTQVRINDRDERVDLPIDTLIAANNGKPIASQLLELGRYEWARVAVSGYWTTYGEIGRNERGYRFAQRRQLRVMKVEILNLGPAREPEIDPAVHGELPYNPPTPAEDPDDALF
jgi:hypothetical protein